MLQHLKNSTNNNTLISNLSFKTKCYRKNYDLTIPDEHIITEYEGEISLLRINEKKSYTTPKGYKILGRVSMDNLSLNSDDKEVCIFDDVNELAKIHDTITYEITTTLNPNIKKEIV